MRAFSIRQFGEPGSVQTRPVPVPQDGEVLVALSAQATHQAPGKLVILVDPEA